jgi:Fe-S-cluster containining protein
MNEETQKLLAKIDALYARLPRLNCQGCGACCVAPTSFLCEFIYMMTTACTMFTHDELTTIIMTPPVGHPDYEGNMRCSFIKKGTCTVYPGRTGACRLFGLETLRELNVDEMVFCRNGITVAEGDHDKAFVESWLTELVTLESTLYPFSVEPYYVSGFPLQCWFDIYFDNTIESDVFTTIRQVMHRHLDLSFAQDAYKPQSGIKEKVDKISLFSMLINQSPGSELKKILCSIRDDYPLTGIYFLEEAKSFIKIIDQNASPGI